MNIPYITKKCSKCGSWLVASTVNFHRTKNGRYGLQAQCKECRNKKNKQWRLDNKDKMTELRNQWYQDNKDKKTVYDKRYYLANKDKIAEQRKGYREANKKKLAEQKKQYREANKDKIAEQQKQWRQSPEGQVALFNIHHRRRIKEEQLGTGVTKEQWLELMSFFDWRCAYSGEMLTKDTRSIDHIVPLNSGGNNMIWNCVPMTRSLNSSKQEKDMEKWYREQSFYDPKRLQKIYKWQEYAYNKWGKDTEYFNTNDIQIKLI